jgi:hypothetical protein
VSVLASVVCVALAAGCSSAADDHGATQSSKSANYGGATDNLSTQQPAGTPNCIDREISWGSGGGLGEANDQHTLQPCNDFSSGRSRFLQKTQPSCSNKVASDASVTVDDVDEAVANHDVQAALTGDYRSYGDSGVADAGGFNIVLGATTLFISESTCTHGPNCTPVPKGIASLQAVLQALSDQQRALPSCAGMFDAAR